MNKKIELNALISLLFVFAAALALVDLSERRNNDG